VSKLVGIEPSVAAISAAPLHRKKWIREGVFRESDFEAGSFDLICCFMTMEHVPDPAEIASSAFRLLRPGGAFVTVTHDYRSFVNRVLGRRSPIIDIEHMQIFCADALHAMFDKAGYQQINVRAFVNFYMLNYWLRLAPLPLGVKAVLTRALSFSGLGRKKIGINVGNSVAVGFKPV
jgi:SAM-dependent methyltransferase